MVGGDFSLVNLSALTHFSLIMTKQNQAEVGNVCSCCFCNSFLTAHILGTRPYCLISMFMEIHVYAYRYSNITFQSHMTTRGMRHPKSWT